MTNETESATDNGPPPAASGPRGAAYLKALLPKLPLSPGVYRMIGDKGQILYVGKAKSLRKRVASYTRPDGLGRRLARMVAATVELVIVTTHTEAEALLLEANLIKRMKPHFNILLRDDKSFPYIMLSTAHRFPRISKHRGARQRDARYFGPFASAAAVNKTLNTLQRAFLLRSCSDSVIENRSRPCLLYQIKRCTAPCVGRIDEDRYRRLVAEAVEFLGGRSGRIQRRLSEQMMADSEAREYEKAAALRDRIQALTRVQAHQGIVNPGLGDADLIAGHQKAGATCIQVFFYRGGHNWGNRAYFPRHHRDQSLADVIGAFIGQFYANKPVAPLVLLNTPVDGQPLIEKALALKAERRVRLHVPQRGDKRRLIEAAQKNAAQALDLRLAEKASQAHLLREIGDLFDLDEPPARIEVYDNSHTSGSSPVAAMIVAEQGGFAKNAYRKFNIKSTGLAPGDDYAMMREVMERRFRRLIRDDPARQSGQWPDLVILDGGGGQLSVALEALCGLGIDDQPVIAIAKGPERNAGRERCFMPDGRVISLPEGSPALYYLQRLRDEAHRFAIGTHRARRGKAALRSRLDAIPGIGGKRKKALLNHFGAAGAVAGAGIEDLEAVSGISRGMAKIIYGHFHPEG